MFRHQLAIREADIDFIVPTLETDGDRVDVPTQPIVRLEKRDLVTWPDQVRCHEAGDAGTYDRYFFWWHDEERGSATASRF